MASATSSGSPKRPIGMHDTTRAGRFGTPAVAGMSVWAAPGATALTRIRCVASSCEPHRERVGGLALRQAQDEAR